MISVSEALALVRFTPEELQKIAKIEATVDNKVAQEYSSGKLAGGPMTFEVNDHVDPKLAFAVARDYEAKGGWRVHVADVAPLKFQFIPFMLPEGAMKKRDEKSTGLPPVVHLEAPKSTHPLRLLVRFPTRSRPKQALEVLTLYRQKAGVDVTIEVIIDFDDETMMDPCVLQRLQALNCVVTVGNHKSKVEACNAGRVSDWDVLLLASDDMVPVAEDYAVRVLDEMQKAWPFLDGAIYFNDGAQGANLNTLPILGRRWYDRWGYVYAPDYQSLFCDTEQTVLWTEMGRLKYVGEKIIEHRHHIWGLSDNDALYRRNDALFQADKKIFEERQTLRLADSQFGFGTVPIWWSICIATLPERREMLTRLVTELYRQIHGRTIEVLIDSENGTIGEKRQRLLEAARGHFVSFVDDDDWIASDYVYRIASALCLDVDCVELHGIMTTSGATPEKFVHSLGVEWGTRDGVHYRSPNHLNPVKRELALQAGFPSLDHGEDHEYSNRLRTLLRTAARVADKPLYYYFFEPAKSEAKGAA